jgi:dihydrofolate reductase
MKFNIIMITDCDYGISKYNKMPWYFTDDLKFFNKTTLNHICIMGSTTAKDLGKPLYKRDNIVISSNYNNNDFIIVRNFEEALKKANELATLDKEIFIIGGSRLFNEAIKSDKLDKIYYTNINKSFGCDNFVKPILGRDDMVYEVINKITTVNKSEQDCDTIGEVELTFYLITKK